MKKSGTNKPVKESEVSKLKNQIEVLKKGKNDLSRELKHCGNVISSARDVMREDEKAMKNLEKQLSIYSLAEAIFKDQEKSRRLENRDACCIEGGSPREAVVSEMNNMIYRTRNN